MAITETQRLARNERLRVRRAANKEHFLKIEAKKRDKLRSLRPDEYRRQWMSANLKRAHGITIEQKEEMLASQHGRCAMCGTDRPGGRGQFHIDHDHATGKIRGILCHGCNTGIGNLRDDAAIMMAAIDYVCRHGHELPEVS